MVVPVGDAVVCCGYAPAVTGVVSFVGVSHQRPPKSSAPPTPNRPFTAAFIRKVVVNDDSRPSVRYLSAMITPIGVTDDTPPAIAPWATARIMTIGGIRNRAANANADGANNAGEAMLPGPAAARAIANRK